MMQRRLASARKFPPLGIRRRFMVMAVVMAGAGFEENAQSDELVCAQKPTEQVKFARGAARSSSDLPEPRPFGAHGVPVARDDAALIRGQSLFVKQCAICHGDQGDGSGKFAYLMDPRPRNFKQGNFKLATTENQIPTVEDILRTIRRGMPGSSMPPWEHLPNSDLEALAKYVKQIHVDAVAAEAARVSLSSSDSAELISRKTQPGHRLYIPPEPAFGDMQWFRGRRIYLEACASCHGVDGHPVADAVKYDNEGYPVPPRSFVNGIFKGGSEGHQLYVRIVKGIKGTPMPSSQGVYSDEEVWDLIHYIQSLAKVGSQERAQLKQGTFVASRVVDSLPASPTDPAWNQARPLYVGLTPLW